MKDDSEDVYKIVCLLQELSKLLQENGGRDHLYGVKAMLRIFSDDICPLEVKMEEARSIYKGMLGGYGTLGDFGISHPDKEKKEKLNQNFLNILNEIWDLLGL